MKPFRNLFAETRFVVVGLLAGAIVGILFTGWFVWSLLDFFRQLGGG